MQYEVIPSRRWRHVSGRAASIYGACPWTGAPGNTREDWTMEETGWTVRNPYNGEVGACRVPFATREEAESFAAKHRPSRLSLGD